MPSLVHSLVFFAAVLSSATAHPHPHDHDHVARKALPGRWYQPEDAPAYKLFRRGGTDGVTYPEVGSEEWYNAYPQVDTIDKTPLPQAWADALNAAVQAGKIPNIPVSTPTGGNPTYGGKNPNSPEICSATYKCRIDGDIWDAPDGVFASSFDDGPTQFSEQLYSFLKDQNQITTHFMIGINIINNPDPFLYAFETLQSDIAVHTWTHRYMTTLTNEQFVGELGWTMEVIHNSTDGRLPKYWRPPYGDSDVRTTAIAREVFGLTTVVWNQDTEDWSIGSKNGATRPEVNANLQKWISGPKSPGLIILEHELSNDTVGAFMQAYPLISQNGWKFESLARMDGEDPYQNSPDDTGDVTVGTVGVLAAGSSPSSSTSSSGSSTSSGTPASSSNNHNPASQTSTSSSSAGASPVAAAQNRNGALSGYASSGALMTLAGLMFAAFVLP